MIRSLFLFFMMGAAFLTATPCFANTSVSVKAEVETKRLTVRLSDLFEGVSGELDREIAQAPAPCKSAVYAENVLARLAETYRLEWQNRAMVDHSVVSSACVRIGGEVIRKAIAARILETQDLKNRHIDIVLDEHNLEVDLPADSPSDFKLENFSYDNASHHFRADLRASGLRGRTSVPLTGHVALTRLVPVLAHRVEAHKALAAADLDRLSVPEERVTDDIVTEDSQLIGRELRRDIGEGELLRARDVMPPRLVARGSLVTLRIQTPVLSITAQGKAEQDGTEGETIRVTNTQSNRIVEGIVVASGLVDLRPMREIASAQ